MTRNALYARAVAYEHSLDRGMRFFRDLTQHELETFWSFVRTVRDANERTRAIHVFHRDQKAVGTPLSEVLP